MSLTNENDGHCCTHNPSSRNTLGGTFFDFLLRKSRLVCSDTELAVCACCGKRIEPPKQYYSKWLPFGYVIASVVVSLVYTAIVWGLINKQPYHTSYFAACGLGLFYITICIIDWIVPAVIFSLCKWEVIDTEGTTEWPPIANEVKAAVITSRREFCRRRRSLRRMALLSGACVLLIVILLVI